MKGAFVAPGGDLPKLKAAAAHHGVTVEKILLTHGHIDHCGEAKPLADDLGVAIEGPHEEDRFWIARLDEDGSKYGIRGVPFEPDRWLNEGDQVTVGTLMIGRAPCRESVCQYVYVSGVAGSFKIKTKQLTKCKDT